MSTKFETGRIYLSDVFAAVAIVVVVAKVPIFRLRERECEWKGSVNGKGAHFLSLTHFSVESLLASHWGMKTITLCQDIVARHNQKMGFIVATSHKASRIPFPMLWGGCFDY